MSDFFVALATTQGYLLGWVIGMSVMFSLGVGWLVVAWPLRR